MKARIMALLAAGSLLGCGGKGGDSGGASGGPELATSHEALDYGTQPFGIASGQQFTIANVGEATLTLDSVTVSEPWTIDGELPGALEPSDSVGVTIAFLAETRGGNNGELVIRSDDPARPELTLPLTAQVESPPVLVLYLDPPEAFTDTRLQAVVEISGDDTYLDLGYAWQVDGAVVNGASGDSLDGVTQFNKNQAVRAVVTPLVGAVFLDTMTADILIQNTPPEPPEIGWSPSDPRPGTDDVLCQLTAAATDIDPEDLKSLVYDFVWTVDGAPFTETGTTDLPGDTVPTASLVGGQHWTCEVTARDPDDGASEPVSIELTIPGLPASSL